MIKNGVNCDKKAIKAYNNKNRKSYGSHEYIINQAKVKKILSKKEEALFFNLKNARVKADYDESESFETGINLVINGKLASYNFINFMDDYKKVNLAFSRKGV